MPVKTGIPPGGWSPGGAPRGWWLWQGHGRMILGHAAYDSWLYEGEPNLASDESVGCTVGLSMLSGNEAGQSLEDNRGGRSSSTTCWQDQRGKGTMFFLENSLLVCSRFPYIVSALCGTSGWWDVEKGKEIWHQSWYSFGCCPKSSDLWCLALPLFCVGATKGESLPSQGLKSWVKSNIRTHLSKEISCDISNAIVSDRWQCFFGAAKSMIHRKQLSIWTVRPKSGWCPSTSET